MLSLGFVASYADSSLFIRHNNNYITLLLLYVDDIIVTGNDLSYISTLIHQLGREFEMTNHGPLTYFLGLQITPSSSGILINQEKYIVDSLQKYNMSACKPSPSPLVGGVKYH